MKKELFILFVLVLFISGCGESPTGKSVVDNEEVNEKILECVKLCNDGSNTEEYFENSCAKILKFGGEETFNDYISQCEK